MDGLRDWLKAWLRPCQAMSRPLRIAEPFIGIGGYGELMRVCEIDYEPKNVYDIQDKLAQYYSHMSGLSGRDFKHFKFGAAGDVLKVRMEDLDDVDGVVCGPPCLRWGGNGKRQGCSDPRSDCYMRVVQWCVCLAKKGCLMFFALENSVNIMKKVHGEECMASITCPWWYCAIVEPLTYPLAANFDSNTWLHNLLEYGLGILVSVCLGRPGV
jgi:hypothetical protein